MKKIVSFSGGKDSTAMLLRLLEEGYQVDEIFCCDTGMEFPEMYEHIKKVQRYIKEIYGKEITILKNEKSFEYYMFDYVITKGKRKGEKGYGWSSMLNRWCTWALKNVVVDEYLKKYDGEGYIKYIGIAYDEQKRMKDQLYPLVDWKMTEKDCLQYCYDRGFDWGGLYEKFDRLSCWCCPLKNQKELTVIYKEYPELWKKLKDMDKRSRNTFKKNCSVEELEVKLINKIKRRNRI